MNELRKELKDRIEYLDWIYSYLTEEARNRKSYREKIDNNIKEVIRLSKELNNGEV